jgi:hypothetical protein
MQWSVYNELSGSDHYPIIMEVENDSNNLNLIRRPRWLLKTANWDAYREKVDEKFKRIYHLDTIENLTRANRESTTETIKKSSNKVHKKSVTWNRELTRLIQLTVPKGADTTRLKAVLEQTIEEEGLRDFTRIFTDGSKMENLVGCAVICDNREIKIRLEEQTCIFNAEAQAIIEAIKATRGITKKIILTDSLSNLMAQKSIYTKGNGKTTEIKDLLAEEG